MPVSPGQSHLKSSGLTDLGRVLEEMFLPSGGVTWSTESSVARGRFRVPLYGKLGPVVGFKAQAYHSSAEFWLSGVAHIRN